MGRRWRGPGDSRANREAREDAEARWQTKKEEGPMTEKEPYAPATFRVRCGPHHYDTLHTVTRMTAINAARMHALTGCTTVEVTGKDGEQVDWQAEAAGVSLWGTEPRPAQG